MCIYFREGSLLLPYMKEQILYILLSSIEIPLVKAREGEKIKNILGKGFSQIFLAWYDYFL